jgi:hypothetical protein
MLKRIATCRSAGRQAVCAAALVGHSLAATPGAAQPEIFPDEVNWTVQPSFGPANTEAGKNISGAACARTQRASGGCIAVNDTNRLVQLFAISGTRILPTALLRLLSEPFGSPGGMDAEAAAFDNGFFYVIGSHGRGAEPEPPKDSSFLVFRFPVDPRGQPTFTVSDHTVAHEIQASNRLRDAVKHAVPLSPFAELPFNRNGTNIEGIVVKDGRMFLGFRAPSINGKTFLMSVDTEAVFATGDLQVKVDQLALGQGVGIRDLAPVETGILILAGPVADQPAAPTLFHWDPNTGVLRQTAKMLEPTNAKAETLLVLEENPEFLKLLVMFDGVVNGKPTQYHVPL